MTGQQARWPDVTGLIVALAAGAVMGRVIDADHAVPDIALSRLLIGPRTVDTNKRRG
jgi:hypothetical protein